MAIYHEASHAQLMYFIVFISYVFHCFYDFYFCNLILINFKINCIINCENGSKDRINTVLVHLKKSVKFCPCVLYTNIMQNADFGQILWQRASTKRHVTSRPMVRFLQTWYQKMRKTWKKKVVKRRVAISGGREAIADFVRGVKLTPPPPQRYWPAWLAVNVLSSEASGHLLLPQQEWHLPSELLQWSCSEFKTVRQPCQSWRKAVFMHTKRWNPPPPHKWI